MLSLEPEVERSEHQQRHNELDAKVIGIRGQTVDAVDVRAADRAVDVDLGRMAGDRLDQRRIEVVAGLCGRELEYAVAGVRGNPEAEPSQHPPVDALA